MDSQTLTAVLDNGLTIVAEPIPGVRSAAFVLLVPAGAVTDPTGEEGMATVLEGLVYRGAGERDARALSDAIDALGVQRSGGAELEHTSFGGSMLSDDLERALALYADVVRRPRLPEDQLAPERDLALQKLDRLNDNPTEKLFVELRRAYFSSPHGRTTLGTRAGLEALTPASVAADHARRYRPDGAILAVAGKIDWPRLQAVTQELFGDWRGSPPPTPAPSTEGRPRYMHVAQETAQEQIGIAYPAVTLGQPGYYETRMMIEVLSGGMGARLFTEVRERRGLVYSVRAAHTTIRGTGIIYAYAGTTPERSQETIEVLLEELRRVADGVQEEEIERARIGLLSALVMQGEASRSRAHAIARDQYLLGRVRTLEEIRAGITAVTPASLVAYLRERQATQGAGAERSRGDARGDALAQPLGDFTIATLGPKVLEIPE